MNLKEQLRARVEQSQSKYAQKDQAIMKNATKALITSKIAAGAKKTGDKVSNFMLPNALGKIVSLSGILQGKKAVVVSFYRGVWCPYCNLELKALQNSLKEIEENNAVLLAISPQQPDKSLSTIEKNELSFEVLSDIDNKVAKQLGLVFTMPEALNNLYRETFKIDVEHHNGNDKNELPMAATYVIDDQLNIIYHFVSEKYTERAEPSDILNVLSSI